MTLGDMLFQMLPPDARRRLAPGACAAASSRPTPALRAARTGADQHPDIGTKTALTDAKGRHEFRTFPPGAST
jgi:hypothetical protein